MFDRDQYYSAVQLFGLRGWTVELRQQLLDEPDLSAPFRLWFRERVERAEQTAEFQAGRVMHHQPARIAPVRPWDRL